MRINSSVVRGAESDLGHPGSFDPRDGADRGGEPAAKQKIQMLRLEHGRQPWLDVLSALAYKAFQFVHIGWNSVEAFGMAADAIEVFLPIHDVPSRPIR